MCWSGSHVQQCFVANRVPWNKGCGMHTTMGVLCLRDLERWYWKQSTLRLVGSGLRDYPVIKYDGCVGSNIGIGGWSVSTYRMSMYTSANSCVDRLNTEGYVQTLPTKARSHTTAIGHSYMPCDVSCNPIIDMQYVARWQLFESSWKKQSRTQKQKLLMWTITWGNTES